MSDPDNTSTIHDQGARKKEFESLTIEHLDALYRQAFSLTRNAAKAEDLVQETYLKAYRAFDSFERGTKIKAWLFKILRNTFISDYRKKKREPEVSLDDENYSFYGAVVKDVQQSGGDLQEVEKTLDPSKLEKYLGDEVTKALETLSEEFREVIYLCDVQELSYQEIASILDVPVGTVRSRLARARGMLQKLLWHYAKDKGLWRRPSFLSKAKGKFKNLFSGAKNQEGFWRIFFV